MARIRSLHPGQWTDEAFVQCSAFARLLALGLRNEADDQGIFEWKPTTLKMRLFPADSVDVVALLVELEQSGQIRRFEVAEKAFGAIRNFRKWQRPEKPKVMYEMPDGLKGFVGLEPTEDSGDLRRTLWDAQDGRCAYCETEITFYAKKANSLEVDHVVPISRGGSGERHNLVATCMPCNRAKGAMTGDEFHEKRLSGAKSPTVAPECGVSQRQSAKVSAEEGGRREEVVEGGIGKTLAAQPRARELDPEVLTIIEAFDHCRIEAHGKARARLAPHATDTVTAQRWVQQGLTAALLTPLFAARHRARAAAGQEPIDTLRFLDRAVAELGSPTPGQPPASPGNVHTHPAAELEKRKAAHIAALKIHLASPDTVPAPPASAYGLAYNRETQGVMLAPGPRAPIPAPQDAQAEGAA